MRGDAARCQCQQFKLWPGESWASVDAEELAYPLQEQAGWGQPEARRTAGLVAQRGRRPLSLWLRCDVG